MVCKLFFGVLYNSPWDQMQPGKSGCRISQRSAAPSITLLLQRRRAHALFRTARRSIGISSRMMNGDHRLRLNLDCKRSVAVSPSTPQPNPSYQTWLLLPPLPPIPQLLGTLSSHPLHPNRSRLPIRVRNRALQGARQVVEAIPPLPSIQPSAQEQGRGLPRRRDSCRSSPCRHLLPTNGLGATPLRLEYKWKVPSSPINPPTGGILSLAGGSAELAQPHPQTTRMRAHPALYRSSRRD